jgi:hypothetical protein
MFLAYQKNIPPPFNHSIHNLPFLKMRLTITGLPNATAATSVCGIPHRPLAETVLDQSVVLAETLQGVQFAYAQQNRPSLSKGGTHF